MPEENKAKTKPKKTKSSMVGSVAKPTVLSDDPKIGIDTAKTFVDNIIDAGVNGGLNISDLESFTTISNARDKIYQLIDTMSQDSTVAAIVKTYAEDVCAVADNGHVMWCESDEPNISKYVNYLLNVMNVDKNLYKWAYCLIKYGDVYLRLYRESDYEDSLFSKDSVNSAYSAKNVLNEDYKKELDEAVRLNMHAASDPYSYYVEMVDDPSSMYELDKYGKTYGYIETPNAELAHMSYLESINQDPNVTYANYRFKSGDVNIYQADDFVHACLDDNFTRYPEKVSLFVSASDFDTNTNAHSYSVKRGKSLLYDSYKVWREKSLLENSVLLNRITRSSILRKVGVEVGDMPKEQVSQVLHRVKDMMENKTAMNKDIGMSEYNNAAPIENFIYFATHNGQGAITVDSVGGDVNVKDLADLDTWINKFYSSYGIPKQYFGWTDDGAGFNGGTALTIISSVYSKGVVRIQNSLIQAITDAINLFLLQRGYRSYINNFTLKMKAPVTQEEISYRESLSNKITALSNMNGLFSEVEDKVNKLNIIKVLVKSLDYGDELASIIDKEIAIAEEAKKKEKQEAEEEAKAAAEEEARAAAETSQPTEETQTEESDDDTLGLSSVAAMESLSKEDAKAPTLTEDVLNDESLPLPSPDELDENIDFSENN